PGRPERRPGGVYAQLQGERPVEDHRGRRRHAEPDRGAVVPAAGGRADGGAVPPANRLQPLRGGGRGRRSLGMGVAGHPARASAGGGGGVRAAAGRGAGAAADGVLIAYLCARSASNSAARSISSSVVNRPTDSRTAPRPTSGGTPIAHNTGDC